MEKVIELDDGHVITVHAERASLDTPEGEAFSAQGATDHDAVRHLIEVLVKSGFGRGDVIAQVARAG